jgi:hypothetical protein
MLSAPSFKDELARYQSPVCKRHRKYQKIIRRWKAHADAEAMWNKIQERARDTGRPALDSTEFIEQVLSATWSVSQIVEYDQQVKDAFEICKKEIIEEVKQSRSPLELLRLLGWRPDFVFLLSSSKDRLEVLDKSSYDFSTPPVSRKDQEGSRDRKAFSLRMRNYLIERCGQPCEEIIAELAQIAFDRRAGVSTDQVRWRPTTKVGRAKKRQRR